MRNIRSTLALAALALLAGLALGFGAPRLGAAERNSPSASVEVHVVSNGDTLWGLAGRLAPGEDPRRFVYEVQRLNGLRGGRIFPGQRLVLPPR